MIIGDHELFNLNLTMMHAGIAMYREAKEHYKDIQKKGKAEVVIQLMSTPDDDDYSENSPACRVRLIAKIIKDGANAQSEENDMSHIIFDDWKEITPSTALEDKTFIIPVENVAGIIDIILFKRIIKTIYVNIKCDPIDGWEERYKSIEKSYDRMTAGSRYPVTISLKKWAENEDRGPETPPLV